MKMKGKKAKNGGKKGGENRGNIVPLKTEDFSIF